MHLASSAQGRLPNTGRPAVSLEFQHAGLQKPSMAFGRQHIRGFGTPPLLRLPREIPALERAKRFTTADTPMACPFFGQDVRAIAVVACES